CARHVGRVDLRTNEDVARLHLGRLRAVDANDVEAVRRLDDRADAADGERERHVLERAQHHAAAEPPEVAAQLLRSGIHRFAARDLLEVAALQQLDEQRLGLRARRRLRRRRGLWCNDDLLEADARLALRERGLALIVRLGHLALAHWRGGELPFLLQLAEDLLLHLLATQLVDLFLAKILWRAEARLAQLGAELGLAA